MPYISQKMRQEFLPFTDSIPELDNPGELNYIFTKIALQYIKDKGESYQRYNDIIGALEGCKLEIYRQQISKYEDIKIVENGPL